MNPRIYSKIDPEFQSTVGWLRYVISNPAFHVIAVASLFLVHGANGWAKEKWDPIPAADLAAKESAASPGTDVEIMLYKQVIESQAGVSMFYPETLIEHHIRAKIYTIKGAEDLGKFRTFVPPDAEFKYLAGRVIKTDGTMLELQKADFHESVVQKYDNEDWKQMAFAFPSLAPGDVVEYRWTQWYDGWFPLYESFFQQEFPVREFRFTVKNFPTRFWFEWRNCTGAKLESDDPSRMTLVVRNIPPYLPEEFMPPEWDFRGGFLLIRNYRDYNNTELWHLYSRYWEEQFKLRVRIGDLKQKAAELIAGATTDDEKLQRLYEFCQNEIVNIEQADSPEAKSARDRRKKIREDQAKDDLDQTAAQTLAKKLGRPEEINYLFAGLARAVGYEVRRTENASRARVLNVQTEKGWALLQRTRVAVKVAGSWRIFSPGSYWVPYGMLDWTDEGVTALRCDDEKVLYETTPLSLAEKSQAKRQGRFSLDAEGTLDGEVTESFAGHEGIALKSRYAEKAADEIDRSFRSLVVERLPAAEVGELHWENLRTHTFPVTVRYKVRVPGYAQQAGKRLIVAPGYFEAGRPALFTEETRKLPIFFPYAREEHDDIEVTLPEGFELDHPSAPANVAAKENTIGARYQIGYKPKQRLLSYKRDFVLGGTQVISFQVGSYPQLKQRFEKLYRSDTHSLILKPKEELAVSAGADSSSTNVKPTEGAP